MQTRQQVSDSEGHAFESHRAYQGKTPQLQRLRGFSFAFGMYDCVRNNTLLNLLKGSNGGSKKQIKKAPHQRG
jgi:hypothetical protein